MVGLLGITGWGWGWGWLPMNQAAMQIAALVAAVDGGGDMSGLAVLGQYGVLGAVTFVLIVYARTTTKRETDRSDRLEAEVFRLNQMIAEQVVPALVSATSAMQASQQLVADLQRTTDFDYEHRRRTHPRSD
jgi:hypothetical protein